MALARANDAVKLAYCQEPTEDEIRRLDLGAVAEFRRSNLGSVEIRFIDRVKGIAGAGRYAGGRGLRGGGVFSARWCRRRRKREGDDTALAAAEEGVRLVGEEEYEDYAAIICDGAIRSGKTLAMGMGFFFWAMACFSDRQFALCGRAWSAAAQPAGNGAAAAAKAGLCLRGEAERKAADRAAARTGKTGSIFSAGERGKRRADPGHDAGGSAV